MVNVVIKQVESVNKPRHCLVFHKSNWIKIKANLNTKWNFEKENVTSHFLKHINPQIVITLQIQWKHILYS